MPLHPLYVLQTPQPSLILIGYNYVLLIQMIHIYAKCFCLIEALFLIIASNSPPALTITPLVTMRALFRKPHDDDMFSYPMDKPPRSSVRMRMQFMRQGAMNGLSLVPSPGFSPFHIHLFHGWTNEVNFSTKPKNRCYTCI